MEKGSSPPIVQVLAILQWWGFNLLVIISNKWIFEKVDFKFPLMVSTVHFICSAIGAYISITMLKLKKRKEVTSHDWFRRILPVAFIFCFDIVLGNVSLRYIPVSFNQTIKAFTPAMTVALKWLVWKKPSDPFVCLLLIPIVGGIVLTTVTELSFNTAGFLAALLCCVTTSTRILLTESLLKGLEFDSLNTLYYMAPYSTVIIALPALLVEGRGVVTWFHAQETLFAPLFVIFLSGVFAFCLNYSAFYAIRATSAVTFTVAGNLKVAIAIFISWIIFANPISFMNAIGCTITVLGITYYAYKDYCLKQHASKKEESTSCESLHLLPVVNEEKLNRL